ncbi:protein SON [Tiliqua scincoides]|uniref:protein SON n=1 Tax=Tiliqua scincoides TaxID=71010 RepID=UPI0034630FA8
MATNIEQIFRSYVVTKFREIQEQQYGGGKIGAQQNGEINSSEQVSPSDDIIATIGNLQNDPLVQKIEQVLSEVLGAESQYKPDDGEDTARSKSHSTKRGLSDEVEEEVPRKKSKKDKKHKDKKKKKKRKKEKKYKKQSKESKLNDQHKGSEDLQSVPDSKAENLNSFLSSEDVDIGSPSKQASEWFVEKNLYENLNSTMSNSRDAFSSDNSKLDTSEEDSVLINIQELSEIKLTNEKENEQHTDLTVHPCVEDESLNIADAESGVCMDRDEVASTKEIKQPEASLVSKAEEKVTVPENSPDSTGLEVEDLGTSLEPDTVETADLNASRNLESLHPETMQHSVPILVDKTDCKFMKPPLETAAESKDSVTTLGFLAMVVGKDFEATSEFLNTAKVKASERSPKQDTFIDMKALSSEKDRTVIVTGLEKNLQSDARAEKKLLEETSESLHVVNENDFEPTLGHKHQPKVLKRITESDARKRTGATLDAETNVRELKESQASAITVELKESEKYSDPLKIAADVKDLEKTELIILSTMDAGEPLSEPTAEVKNLGSTSELEEMNTKSLKAKSVREPENWKTVPESLRMVDVRNLVSSPKFERDVLVSYLETPLQTVVEEREGCVIAKDSETVAKLKTSESFSRSGTAPEIKTTLESPGILKTQYLKISKYAGEADIESETLVKLKELEKVPESLLIVKNVASISESQYVKEIKNMDDVLQCDAVAQRIDSETSLVLEEERDSDAASESLHMIFANYSEHSLEPDTEPEAIMESKTSESIPELFPVVDANSSEELRVKEIKDLKPVESEAMIKLNDLEKKLKSLHREVKNLEMPAMKCFQSLVASEAMAKRKNNETVSHSVTGVEKASIEYMEKDQNGAEAVGFKILPECQKMAENEPSAKTESLLLISKSLEEKDVVSSETTPELGGIAAIQKLKETVGFKAVLDIGSSKETFVFEPSGSVDDQEASTSVNTAKDFEPVSAPFQTIKTKDTEVILDSRYGLEDKYPETSTEFLFSGELGNLEKKQKLKDRTETTGSAAAPESLYASQRDLIIVPESDEANKAVNLEHGAESSYMAKTNSENVLKSLYMIEAKDSKSLLGSKFLALKGIEIESETTLREGVEIGDLPEYESVVASKILEITSDSSKKIEMPLEPQCTPVLQVSDAALRSALTFTDLEANSETICVINIENLEVSPECEELEVVKTSEMVPTIAVEMMDSIATPSSDLAVANKETKAIKTIVKNLKASTDSMDILEEAFEPACITGVKEASQNLETNLDYFIKEELNNAYTESAHEVAASGLQTFQRCIPIVSTHISDVLAAADNMVKKSSGTDVKQDVQSVVKYSESVCQSENVLEREDCDTTVVLMEIKDSGASSSFSDTGEKTLQLETISQSLCEFKSRDSADAVEAPSNVETKDLGRALNYSTVLEVQDPVASGTHLNASKSSESVRVLEVSGSEEILELKTAPTYLEVFQFSGATTETRSSETEYVLEAYSYSAASVSEGGLVKVSETMPEVENVEDLETIAKSKDTQEIKGMKSPQSLSTVEVRDFEESVMLEEVLDVSETAPQFSSISEVKDLEVVTPSAVAKSAKDSEKQLKLQLHFEEKCLETLECTQISDIMGTYEDGEPGCSITYPEPTADMTHGVDSNNSEANSGFIGTVDLTESFVKSTQAIESLHSKEVKDFQATPKCGSIGEINVLQVAQLSAGKEEGLDLEGIPKSTVALEKHDLERNLPSVSVSEEKTPEVAVESSHAVKAKDSEAPLEYKNGKDVNVLEQNSKCIYMAEMKNLESTPECDVLAQTKTSEMIPKITSKVKDSEAILKPLRMVEEKDLDGTPQVSLEEQVLKATLKPVCTGAEDNLEANQQLTTELKDSEVAVEPVCMAEKVKGSEVSLESVHTAKEKDLEATAQVSMKDQDLKAAQISDIKEKNEGSILKDKKSEKISSKSKDKSKSGKRAKKSRSKSPSKSKKRKKKSRSRSTSRRITSRRGRSRSRDDSDSRKKHSSSRHKSRSKSVDKKDSKESSLRSRRRRSRTSDHPKSRSRSVEKIRSRWRRSRSSDHHKSRSRSVDKRESARRKRRLSRSSEKRKSRSKSVDRRETLTRSRRRRSRSSDHRKSRSQSADKRDTAVRTRRKRSRSSDRSRSVDKRDTSARRRRRRSRTSDNCKSRSKSFDRRESSIRTRRRRSRSSDHHKSRSRSVDDKRDTSLRSRRKRSRSLDKRKSRSRSVVKESSVRTRRRRSRSSDNRRSRSKSVDKRETSVRTRRKRSRSLDNRKSRSKSVDKRETSVRARRRRSRSSDNRKSRSRSADKRETSVRTRRKRSRSSDNRKSRSRSLDKGDSSVRARRRRSRSSDLKSRSRSVDKRETSVRTRRKRSRSSDNHRSRSKSVDKRETSVKTRQRRSRSLDHRKSRSRSPDKRETSVRTKRRQSHSSDNRKSRSKSLDKIESSAKTKRKRSRSSDSRKSRSKSVEKIETLTRSKRQRSQSSDQKSKTKCDEKGETSLTSRHRSKSLDRQRSKSKSRSKSSERRQDKNSSDKQSDLEKLSKSRSNSLEKIEGTESLEAPVCNHTKSPEHHKSKSRSRSKSLDKTRERERLRRSRSKGSKSPEPKSRRHRTVSRSRRNRSRSLTRKRTSRSKSEHRSRTRSRTRSRSCSRRWRRSRSRSLSRQRSLSRDRRRRSRRNRSRSTERRRRRSDSRDSYRVSLRLRSRSRTPARLRSTGRRRSTSKSPDHRRSRSSSRSPKRLTDLDKAQLLEIAKANAAAMCAKAGVPLPPSLMPVLAPEKKEEKVVQKSAKETIMELTEKCKKIAQSQDDVIINKPHVSDEEEEEHPFINHPFKLNEPKPIFFNLSTPSIKPAPPKNQVTLTKEFPVSSGSQHRKKEADSAYGEWVPVEKNKDETKDDVFPNPANLEPVDISSALNERTIAQKRLTENTFDLEAMCLLNRAQERIDAWAQLNSIPGQFTGSTGAQVLTSEQLSNSGPQAWIKKDQFLRAAPVSGGMGAQLMRKMGWREGEGLGKNKEGNKEPILVDFKIDRKGLVAVGEKTQKRHGLFSAVKDLSGKHPVSALVEACNKRRWSPPVFVLVHDNGPEHRKHFLFKVMVNGVEHKPTNPSPNKKHAKAAAATVALQALGIVPKELMANATSFRSASHI